MCPGTPTCCALSPGKAHVALCGTAEGGVLLWDLREPAWLHATAFPRAALRRVGVRNGLRFPRQIIQRAALNSAWNEVY